MCIGSLPTEKLIFEGEHHEILDSLDQATYNNILQHHTTRSYLIRVAKNYGTPVWMQKKYGVVRIARHPTSLLEHACT